MRRARETPLSGNASLSEWRFPLSECHWGGGTLRNRASHHHCGGDRPAAVLRRRYRPGGGWPQRRATQRRAAHPQHSARGATRALESRCRFPGCPATHRLHGHHVQHWANGGETSLDNLVLLCPTHHRLVHDGGFDVQRLDDGAFRFINPYGLSVRPPRRSEPSSPEIVIRQNDALGIAVDCETATAHWYGERIDYDHALMVTMASWDSGDTVPEAGPAAGDLNPS